MKTQFALGLAACLCLLAMSPRLLANKAGKDAPPPADTRADLTIALKATAPHASLGDQAKVFGRLVGSWDVEYMDISKDGREMHRTGQLVVAWVLDGRAIQDVWIVDPSEGRTEREVYADFRYFDPKSRSWPAVFVDPEHASMAKFTGGVASNDRIVLESPDLGRPQTRWSFNDIGTDTFVFRDEYSSDGGQSWKLQAEYHMKRREAASR